MRSLAALAVLLLIAVTASQATAGRAFRIDLCGLLSAKQAAAMTGSHPLCHAGAKAVLGPAETTYNAIWITGPPFALGPAVRIVHVTVYDYTKPSALTAQRIAVMSTDLPGTSKRLRGIGSLAYEASGGNSAGVNFRIGHFIAFISVQGTSSSPKLLVPLAKLLARKL